MVPVILDIEASGFGAQSYPIEIGFAFEFLLKEPQMRVWQRSRREVEAELGIPRHRASTDALSIQRTYLRALGRASANA